MFYLHTSHATNFTSWYFHCCDAQIRRVVAEFGQIQGLVCTSELADLNSCWPRFQPCPPTRNLTRKVPSSRSTVNWHTFASINWQRDSCGQSEEARTVKTSNFISRLRHQSTTPITQHQKPEQYLETNAHACRGYSCRMPQSLPLRVPSSPSLCYHGPAGIQLASPLKDTVV